MSIDKIGLLYVIITIWVSSVLATIFVGEALLTTLIVAYIGAVSIVVTTTSGDFNDEP
ncbi:hypothetical protein LCGC14_0534610 [marine sediment metagenome]|uniref:Uncharacterized protein n=1 Tax=marine sediment metagenome TaxID=412755 RepID=A0A0F9RUM6_9ZZZZ